jgi:two-component system, OmpR family, phosphate regulon response regulator PhoB
MNTAPTILFVDDDRDFLMAQHAWFGAHGFRVLTAETGDEAMAAVGSQQPSIIFLDLMMEHYDSGFTLGRRLRQVPGLAEVPIVMLSGVAAATGRRFDEDTAGLKEWSKLDGFLDKPVTSKQLMRVIETMLPRA